MEKYSLFLTNVYSFLYLMKNFGRIMNWSKKNRGKRESRKLTQNKGVNLINPAASVSKKKSGSDDSR